MIDVTALGELLIDFTPEGKNAQGAALFSQNPGGAPANVLAMVARLGGRTAFIGKAGQDAFGRYLRQVLTERDIDASGLVLDGAVPTTLAFVHLDEKNDRSFTFYRSPGADQMLTAQEVSLELIDRCRIFHFGSVSLTRDPSRGAALYAAEYAGKQGKLVSFDPNLRPMLWESKAEARAQIEHSIRLADILKVSEEEMEFLTGTADLTAGSEYLLNMGPALVLVSLGEQGSFFRNHAGYGSAPPCRVEAVDTTGAGDAFAGAVLWKVRNMTRAELCSMPVSALGEIAAFSNAAGALTATGKGAIPAMPDTEQIHRCLKKEV